MDINLRIPGPTPLPPSVLQALAQPMIGHRGAEFRQLFRSITADLQAVFQTENDVLLLAASGTGAMEAAIVNTVAPGGPVLSVSVGYFGDRFAAIAETCGAAVTRLTFPWGQAAKPEAIVEALRAAPGTKAVLVTHNETATGVTNDLEAIAAAVHSLGEDAPLLLVDAVSAIGAIELRTDAWGCDIVATCSQKALMAPPGLGLLSVGPKAWKVIENTPARSYYFDLKPLRKRAVEGQTPATPPVSDMFGLRAGLDLILAEGLANVFIRHHRVAEHTRQGITALGLELFADPGCMSDTVTAVEFPTGTDSDRIRARLREEFSIAVGGGQGPVKGQIIRIGHMGYVTEADIDPVIEALATILR